MTRQLTVPAKEDKPSLGDAQFVHDLLQKFETKVLSIRARFFRGVGGKVDPQQRLLDLCKTYGDIIDGTNKNYARPDIEQACCWMRIMIKGGKDEECIDILKKGNTCVNVGQAFLLMLAKITMDTADMVGDGMTKEASMARMSEVNKHFGNAILAIPPQFD